MSITTHSRRGAAKASLRSAKNSLKAVGVTAPASKAVRDEVSAKYRAAHGFDLSDEDRAARVRGRFSS